MDDEAIWRQRLRRDAENLDGMERFDAGWGFVAFLALLVALPVAAVIWWLTS